VFNSKTKGVCPLSVFIHRNKITKKVSNLFNYSEVFSKKYFSSIASVSCNTSFVGVALMLHWRFKSVAAARVLFDKTHKKRDA